MKAVNSGLVSISEMTEKGRRMFRDNFFHAVAMELHRTSFYQLVELEKSAFNSLSRFQLDMTPLIERNENWTKSLEEMKDSLWEIHEKFRDLVNSWTSFAVKDSRHLVAVIIELIGALGKKSEVLESLSASQQELSHYATERFGRIMETATKRISMQHDQLMDLFSRLNLGSLPGAFNRLESGNVSLAFVETPDSDFEKAIGRLMEDGIVQVREAEGISAQYFIDPSGSLEEYWIPWDFSSKDAVKRTYLDVSPDDEGLAAQIVGKKGTKKDQVAMELFGRMTDAEQVRHRLGERICLYWEQKGAADAKPDAPVQYFPGISLLPHEFWPLVMNLSIFHETKEALALEVVEQHNPILIRYLNVPSRNRGRFRACVNPVSI